MSQNENLNKFIKLIRSLSYEKRDVTLASGKKSDFYVDMKNTLLHPEGGYLAAVLILEKIKKKMAAGMKVKGVGGLTMGADPISTGVSILSHKDASPLFAFYVRKEPKGHGTQVWVEGIKNFSPGDKVVILEDVVTTGCSTIKSVERARLAGLDVVGVISTVDREEGGAENIRAAGLDFDSVVTRSMILENG